MARAENTELIDRFEQFYRDYYADEIGELAQQYPNEKRSLYIDWDDLYRYDVDIADDYLAQPQQIQEYAEEALRLYDLPVDVSLGQAHVRIRNLPETTVINSLRARHVNTLVAVEGVVVDASDVQPKIQEAAFECQRCGTLTYIPQSGNDIQKPHECQGCERRGPFRINFDQSELIDAQELVLHDLPGTDDRELTELPVRLEDDITGLVTDQDRVTVVGILHLQQEENSSRFDTYLDALSVSTQDTAEWVQWDEYLDVERPIEPLESDSLETFVTRSRQILDEGPTLDEFGTQTKIITPFLNVLGWNVYAPEVQMEYPRNDDTIDDRADYVLFRDGSPAVAVEAKRAGRSLQAGIQQTKRYMRLIGTDCGLVTNGERYVLLCSDIDSEEPAEEIVLDATLEELPSHQHRLSGISNTPPVNTDE